jgi:dihydroorotate dehydrogenase
LQGRRYLAQLLASLVNGSAALAGQRQSKILPLLLKISPDLTWPQLDVVLEVAEEQGVGGIVVCNTTISRAGLRSR